MGEAAVVHVILTDRRQIEKLNREFLGHEGPTDVLAFDMRSDPGLTGDESPLVGEIYVCSEVAGEAAQRYSTTPAYEIVLYVVHGLLHLAGMDDRCAEARRQMRAAERRIMAELESQVCLEQLLTLSNGGVAAL